MTRFFTPVRSAAAIQTLLSICWATLAFAAWPFGGQRVAASGGSPAAIAGAGGVVVAWQSTSTATADIYAGILDAGGTPIGSPGGVALCTAAGNQTQPGIVSDGAGGAIVFWQDQRTGAPTDLYAQRLTAAGATPWTVDGTVINAEIGNQINCAATSDGAGGAVFTWQSGSPPNIFAQRLDASGARTWPAAGAPVCVFGGTQQTPQIVADGTGGYVIVWSDLRSGSAIYAQRLDSSGAPIWTVNGIPVYSGTGTRGTPRIGSDGAGGIIVVWQDNRAGAAGIYAQKLNLSGALQWNPAGVRITVTSTSLFSMVMRGDGGVIVGWQDNLDVRAEMLSSTGVKLNPDGSEIWVCTAPGGQSEVRLVPDGSGGAIVTWLDNRSTSTSVFAQRLDALGAPQWAANGIPVAVSPDFKTQLAAASGDAGALLVAWPDQRSRLRAGVYAQKLDPLSLPMAHVVTGATDAALRTAIEAANASPAVHHWITFNIAGPGPHVISPSTPLPTLAVSTVLDGCSQPGAALNLATPGQPSNGSLAIELAGSPSLTWGLDVSAPECALRGIAVHGFPSGGVRFATGSTGSSIEGSHVGTNAAGLAALANGGDGIRVEGVTGTITVGTEQASARNVIGGNAGAGVRVNDATEIRISGNHIGLGAGGGSLGNGGDGIRIEGTTGNVHIGHSAAQSIYSLAIPPGGNAIRHNGGAGIRIAESVGPSIFVSANGVDGNVGLAMDTAESGPNSGTPATSYTAAPVLTSALLIPGPPRLVLSGSASGPVGSIVSVQVFASDACDASGFGEGARYIGTLGIVMSGGTESFTNTLFVPEANGLAAEPGNFITAVTLVPEGPTSEYSPCRIANNTDTGTGVALILHDPNTELGAELTFAEVTSPGVTTLDVLSSGPPVLPSFAIGDPPFYYDVSTTATFTSAELCIPYDEDAIGIPETGLTLLHYDEAMAVWVDVTTSLDTDENRICGVVTSFSPFIIAQRLTVGVEDPPALPARIAFRQVSASPARGSVRFALELPRRLTVDLRIHDVAGRAVHSMAAGDWAPGIHVLEWSGEDVPAGIYFVSGWIGDVRIGRRIVLLR
jgi:hypothetical protein